MVILPEIILPISQFSFHLRKISRFQFFRFFTFNFLYNLISTATIEKIKYLLPQSQKLFKRKV